MRSNYYLVELLLLAVGIGVGYWLSRWKERNLRSAARIKEQTALENAQRQAENLLRESRLTANEEALKLRTETETLLATQRKELAEAEVRLTQREGLINRQLENLMEEEKRFLQQQKQLHAQLCEVEQKEKELNRLAELRRQQLQSMAHLSEADARTQFFKEIEQQNLRDAVSLSRNVLQEAKTSSEEKAKRIISLAIQRYAAEHTFETTTATVALSGEDMKGRIIGREGRNIRAFEACTGVTVLIDDTPNAVVLSGFDPVRREIARESMQRLILDGRIHPTRIEEVVAKVTQEIDEAILKAGQEAVMKVGLPPMHEEINKLLGRLRFRHSFSQNILDHSIEVAELTGLMASELGLEIAPAKRAGLLHDIGKAVSHEIEGPHALVGADLIKRYGESPEVVDGVASHHDEVPHEGLLGILVSAADAISGSRPGARSESMSTYIKRLEQLERISASFPGVEKAYAVQAGRELRVIVHPDQVSDENAYNLARSIVRRIEDELQYPGQIRVTVIRETRVVEFAK